LGTESVGYLVFTIFFIIAADCTGGLISLLLKRNCMGQHGWYSFFFGLYYTVIGPAYAEAYLLGLLLLCLDPTRFPLRDSTHLLPWFNSDYCSFIFQLNLGDS